MDVLEWYLFSLLFWIAEKFLCDNLLWLPTGNRRTLRKVNMVAYSFLLYIRYQYDTSPFVFSPYNTTPYGTSRSIYDPVRFIPERDRVIQSLLSWSLPPPFLKERGAFFEILFPDIFEEKRSTTLSKTKKNCDVFLIWSSCPTEL